MTQNPLWPLIDEAVCWSAGPGQSSVQPYWCSMIERTEGSNQTTRGKDYELDQVQPGEMKTRWRNDDGAFDGDNTISPYAGFINPYRLIRRRKQYPATANLLTQNQATAGQATVIANAPWLEQPWPAGSVPDANSVYQNGFVPTTIAASASAFVGGQVFSSAWPAGGVYPTYALGMRNWSVAPGTQYAASVQARAASLGITVSAQLQLAFYTAAGTLISVANGATVALQAGPSAAWTQLSVTAAAPANAAGALVQIVPQSGPASSWTLHTSGWDVRKGSIAGFSTPGTWYPVYTGYIERWPQSWTSGGNYGVVDLTAVDLFTNLANHEMLGAFKADLLALNPNFLYALDEASGTNVFADLTNKRGPAVVSRGALSLVAAAGTSVASANALPPGPDQATALTGAFLGAAGPVVHSTATTSSSSSNATGAILIPPDPVTGLVGPPPSGGFTRLIAARITNPASFGTQSAWIFYGGPAILYNNQLEITMFNSTSSPSYIAFDSEGPTANAGGTYPVGNPANAGTLLDGDWHLYGISLSADGKTLSGWLDSSSVPTVVTSGSSARPVQVPASIGVDSIAGLSSGYLADYAWGGDVAFACELPFEMTGATWANLAQSWRNAWSTTNLLSEATDARYQRILNWLNYAGPARLSAGVCKSVGPATDVAGQFGLQCLQNVVDTESGQHFIGADGAVVFQSRRDRYNPSPVLTFGENTAAGEIPYLDLKTDKDPTRVGNDARVTSQYGNALYRTQDATSQSQYGQITISRTVNSVDPNELTAASQFLVYANKDPLTRLQAIKIDVAALAKTNPGIWATLLALELGSCVQVKRRPSNAPTISLTCFVEKIVWDVDDQNRAYCTLQLSNAAKRNFAKFDTARYAPDTGSMTLQSGITAAQATLTIVTAAGKPTMTNTPASYPFDIIIDAEQITLTAAPGGTTSPQTFTVIRGVNGTTAAAHAASAVISLAVPAIYAY